MKKIVKLLFGYFIFWLIYFELAKVLFLALNYKLTGSLSFSEVTGVFLHGIKMDVSVVCVFLAIPMLLLAFSFLLPGRFIKGFLKTYTLILLIPISFLSVVDLGMYPHWGIRVGISSFNYIGDPKSMFATISLFEFISGISGIIVLCVGFFLLYRWLFKSISIKIPLKQWYLFFILLLLAVSLIIPIRGGLGTSPMNLSTVSFSKKLYANHAAANYLWNFINTIENRKVLSNPCIYMEQNKSQAIFDSKTDLISENRIQLVESKNGKPVNVVVVILESFSNKIVSSLGGMQNISPNLERLCSEGIVFSNFYATGNRSDKGISSIFAGYPSLLHTSIMRFADKSKSITKLPQYFKRNGYQTSFYYGGDINFYNLKAFILQSGMDQITSQKDFPEEIGYASSWGAPDEFLFEKASKDIKTSNQPFLNIIYTLSSHTPYDVPFTKIKGNSNEAKYLNSVAYTDSCLGVFIDELRLSDVWENTLLIVTSDHGTLEPGPTEVNHPSTYKIPMVWSGGVINDTMVIDSICMQPDLLPTLVHQMGWQIDNPKFGTDIFSQGQYAFYMLESGWGFISPAGQYYYNKDSRDFIPFTEEQNSNPDFDFAKAYLQVLHDDFINR